MKQKVSIQEQQVIRKSNGMLTLYAVGMNHRIVHGLQQFKTAWEANYHKLLKAIWDSQLFAHISKNELNKQFALISREY